MNEEANLNSQSSVDKSSVQYTERFVALMEGKLRILDALQQISTAQSKLSPLDELDAIWGLVARRDVLVDQLSECQAELVTYSDDDPEQRVWVSIDRRSYCRQLAQRIESVLQDILRLDQANMNAMCVQRDIMGIELQNGINSQLAEQAYLSSGSLQAGVLDIENL